MDKFEKLIKDSVQGYEAPYNPDAWKFLNKKLGPSKGTITKWILGSAAAITIMAVSYNYLVTDTNPINKSSILADDTNKQNNVVDNKAQSNDATTHTDNSNHNTNDLTENIDKQTSNKVEDNTLNNNDFTVEAQPNIDIQNTELNTIETNPEIEQSNVDYSSSKPEYKADVVVNKSVQCLGEPFSFTPSVPKQKVIYEWDLGDGTVKNGGVINHTYSSAGTYTVQLTLKDRKTNKIVKQSETVDATVLSVPQTSFVYEESNGIVPETNFRNETQQIKSTQWNIVGLYASSRNEFNYSFKQKGEYVVKLTTTAENGCSNTATKIITIEKDYNLLAPTAFTPNDDFLNDKFIPKALPLLNLPFTMTIYDRQGKLVYQTTDANQPWDGLYTKDGVPAPNGVYVWVVQLTNENGEIEVYQDQVTITR